MIFLISSSLQFLLLFILRSRYIFGGDSSEFVTVANTWSIAHPPGYPLYSFLANSIRVLFPFLGHIDPVNLLSILPTVGTGLIVYLLICKLTKSKFVALISSWFYILLYPVWLYAEVPEVFALNSFFVAATTYIIVRLNESEEITWKALLGLTAGLAFVHHQTYLVFLLPWFLLIKDKRGLFTLKSIFYILIFLILGLSFYLYAPIASFFKPPLDVENASTLEGFVRLVTRASYGTFRSYNGSEANIFNQILNSAALILYLLQDFRVIGLLFVGVGLGKLFKKNRRLFIFFCTAISMQLLFLFYLNFYLNASFSAAIFERFLIAGYFFCMIPLGVGMDEIKPILNRITYISKHVLIKKYVNLLYYFFLIMVVTLLGIGNLKTIRLIPTLDAFDNFGKDMFNTLPVGAMLSTNSDNGAFVGSYYYYVKKYRPDVKLISLGLIQRKHYQRRTTSKYPSVELVDNENYDIENFVKLNANNFPIFVETPTTSGVWVPIGILWKFYPSMKDANKNMDTIFRLNNELWLNVYHLPVLTRENSNLIHMRALNDHYVNKLISYVKLLVSKEKYKEAVVFLKIVVYKLNSGQNLPKSLLMSTYAKLNQCNEGQQLETKTLAKLDESNSEELANILVYYYLCDRESQIAQRLFTSYENLNKKQKLQLNSL